jgi:hypothetical protein
MFSNIIDSRLSHGRSEALRDTSELLFPEENDGYSTIEIFNQEGYLPIEAKEAFGENGIPF